MDSLRDKVWRSLLLKKIQTRYVSAKPDAFPMPKPEYLFPKFDEETWIELVRSFVESLEVLKEQAIMEAENPPKPEPPWMKKSSSSGLFENVYPKKELGQ